MNVQEYLDDTGQTLYWLCKQTGISYTTLHPHVRGDHKPISLKTARRLEEFDPAMSAAEIVGLVAVDGKRRPRPKASNYRKAAA